MRLDDLDAKIDQLLSRSSQPAKPSAGSSASVRRPSHSAAKNAGRSRTAKKGKK
jgi:hypothetical protein